MAWTSLNEEASGYYQCLSVHQAGTGVSHPSGQVYRAGVQQLKWFTEFGHLNRGDMLTSEQHRCHNEKKKFQRRV